MMDTSSIDHSKPQKLYSQLIDILREPIEQGSWQIGARIPTEEQICRRFSVSKTTVRLAIEQLVSFGYLRKIQGRGTFVRRRVPEENLRMSIYLNAETTEFTTVVRYHLIEVEIVRPDPEIADFLGLAPGELCRRFSRVQTLDGFPLALEKLYLPLRLCRHDAGESEEVASLTSCVEVRCATRIQRIREKTDVPGDAEREGLPFGLSPQTPALRIRQIFFKAGDQPVGFAETIRRMDRGARILEFERL